MSLLTAMVELQVDNSCTATKTTFILAFGWLNTDIVLPGGDGELLSQGGVQLLGGGSSSKVVLAWIKEQIPSQVLWLAMPAIQKSRQYNS